MLSKLVILFLIFYTFIIFVIWPENVGKSGELVVFWPEINNYLKISGQYTIYNKDNDCYLSLRRGWVNEVYLGCSENITKFHIESFDGEIMKICDHDICLGQLKFGPEKVYGRHYSAYSGTTPCKKIGPDHIILVKYILHKGGGEWEHRPLCFGPDQNIIPCDFGLNTVIWEIELADQYLH